MTGFAGAVLLQALFGSLRLKERLVNCFSHLDAHSMFRHGVVFLTVVVQLMLGFRHLRSVERLQADPLVNRLRAIPPASGAEGGGREVHIVAADQSRLVLCGE